MQLYSIQIRLRRARWRAVERPSASRAHPVRASGRPACGRRRSPCVGCRCRLRPAPGTRVPPGPRSACAGPPAAARSDVAPIDAAKAGQNLFRLRRQPSKSHRLSMIHTAVLEILIRRSRRARARPRARGRESASYCKTYGSCAARAWPANRMHSATRGRREHHASELSPSLTAPRRALRRGVLVHTSRFDPRTEAAGLTPCLYRDGIAEATR